ncbi:MAG TPA: hypothetical protein VIT45_03500 [Allosphingosinicella sp.]
MGLEASARAERAGDASSRVPDVAARLSSRRAGAEARSAFSSRAAAATCSTSSLPRRRTGFEAAWAARTGGLPVAAAA